MHIICLTPLEEGVYNDHASESIVAPPDGWAYIPEDFPLPTTFPRLDKLEAALKTYTREVKVAKEVIDKEGNTRTEPVTEEQEYTMMTVTAMTEGTIPEVERDIVGEIAELKEQLDATDYKVIKCYEAQLKGVERPYDVNALCDERQALRDKINELESQL